MEPNEWLIYRFAQDGYDVISLPNNVGYLTAIIDPDSKEFVQRFVSDDLTKKETVQLFWDISKSIKFRSRGTRTRSKDCAL